MQNLKLEKSNVELTPEEATHLEALGITPERADELLLRVCGKPPRQFTLLTLAIALLDRTDNRPRIALTNGEE